MHPAVQNPTLFPSALKDFASRRGYAGQPALTMKIFPRPANLVALACALLAPARAADAAEARNGDTPWKIHQAVAANYPLRLMRAGIAHGEARVRVSIAANGGLNDALLVSASRREFGEEALRVVKQWRFEPERVKGEPVGGVGDISFIFEFNGPIAIEKLSPAPNEEPRGSADPFAYQAETLKRLDRIPAPTHVVPPVYPKDWSDRGIAGSATVEFFIDETGQPRIPVVIATDHRFLGASAVAAVAQWRFEPPQAHGQPALVHAEQVFTFQAGNK